MTGVLEEAAHTGVQVAALGALVVAGYVMVHVTQVANLQ